MDDADYAEKYAEGASKTDVLGKLKQAGDARFVEGAAGSYYAGGITSRPGADSELASIEIGGEGYLTSYLTGRTALSFMSDFDDIFTGGDIGFRLQIPTRLAPFVGAGVFVGYADETVSANDDNIDNDEDGRIDEPFETRERISGMLASIYPETGIHFWWNPQCRLSGFGRYMVTTSGRKNDDWLIGLQLAIFEK